MPDESMRVTRTVTLPDGGVEPKHSWLCTSPIHYRNILEGETMRYWSQPGVRFVLDRVPLEEVMLALYERGF